MKSNHLLRGLALTLGLALVAPAAYAGTTFDPKTQPFAILPPVAITGFKVASGDAVLFNPWFDPVRWIGEVTALPVDAQGKTDLATKLWSASTQLNAQHWDTGRNIVTYDPVAGSPVPFRWNSGIGAAQQTAIGTEAVLNFIRGDRSNEKELTEVDGSGVVTVLNPGSSSSGSLRGRYSLLGDVLHGRIAYVGAPPADYIFDSYQTFKTANASRAGRVYVGANDGMLHALDAATGNEVFAYIPYTLIGKLNLLSVTPYDHNYFVDGSMTVGDANFGTTAVPNWKTVLVGGLGAGGKGYYAIDVTDPAAANETAAKAKVLWEINSAKSGFGDLGYTYGDISIGRVNCPVVAPATTCTRWVAIVANGYLSASGKAVLYVVDLTDGTLVKALDTGSGSIASPNGLSSPTAVDTSLDGVLDYVYAGDMDGNVWKFNIKDPDKANWSTAQLHAAEDTDAVAAGVQGRPILGAVDVAPHPVTGYLVYFGTGRLFTKDEASDAAAQNYVYAVWDGANNGGTTFLSQTISSATYGGSVALRVATGNEPNWSDSNRCEDDPPPVSPSPCLVSTPPHKGWKVALPVGEHLVTGGFVRDSRFHIVAVNTSKDNSPNKPEGANWLMELNLLTGGAPPNVVFDLSSDGLLDDNDRATDAGGSAIAGPEGVPLGIYLGSGMFSTPSLVTINAFLSTTIYNNNPYVSPGNAPDTPVVEEEGGRGVAGGHFDVDIYFPNPKICSYSGGSIIVAVDAKYQIQVNSTTHTYGANVGDVSLGGTVIASGFAVTDGTATTTNATALKNAINAKASGYTATVAGNVVTISTPAGSAASGNGKAFTYGALGTPVSGPTGGSAATGKIVIGAQPAGSATRITNVVFNGASVLAAPIGWNAGTSIATIAAGLRTALSAVSGFTTSLATTNVANDTILFTQSGTGAPAPTISVVSSNGNINDVRPTALIQFGGGNTSNSGSGGEILNDLSGTQSVKLGTTNVRGPKITIGKSRNPTQAADKVRADIGIAGAVQAYTGGNAITTVCAGEPVTSVCLVDTGSYTNGRAVTIGTKFNFGALTATLVASAGASTPTAAVVQPTSTSSTAGTSPTGNDDLSLVFVTSQSVTGQDAGESLGTLDKCTSQTHNHEYDDMYDVTGVNFLGASNPAFNLSNAISSTSTRFKVIAQNQYLSPAVMIELGSGGAVSVKDFATSETLNAGLASDPVNLPVYSRDAVGKFQYEMPRDAFKAKDWWGNGDVRVGLHPTQTGCVKTGSDTLFQAVVPPVNGVDGPGTVVAGTGARHNGALVFQVIKESTPNSALEMNLDGRPEYGWRVKAANFETYVLAEYTVFWHHPNGACYGSASWVKRPPEDPASCLTDSIIAGMTIADAQTKCYKTPAAGSSDPGLGTSRPTVTAATTTSVQTGTGMSAVLNTTVVITYSDGSTMTITSVKTARTLNGDGTVRSWNTGTQTVSYTGAIGGGGGGSGGGAAGGGASNQGSTVANTITGYQQSRNAGKLGRVSWRELIRE